MKINIKNILTCFIISIMISTLPAFATSVYNLTEVSASSASDPDVIYFPVINSDNTLTDKYYRITLSSTNYGTGSLSNITNINFLGNNIDITLNYNPGDLQPRQAGGFISGQNIEGQFVDLDEGQNYGGGIWIPGSIINNIEGNFFNNIARREGGAIYNEGTINNITGDFIANSVQTTSLGAEGGALNIFGLVNGSITGNFINNYAYSTNAGAMGGAIQTERETNNIFGDFIGNYAHGTTAYGGALSNSGGSSYYGNDARIQNLVGDFIYNYSLATTGDSYGGAIYNTGDINYITGNFINNYTQSTQNAKGGALYSGSTSPIISITGNFINNKALGTNSGCGGAIYNSGTINSIEGNFINNTATHHGGAIYNYNGTIGNITGDFYNNSVIANSYGGAVYTNSSLTFTDSSFINNSSYFASAIHAPSGAITINAVNKDVIFDNYNSDTAAGFVGTTFLLNANTNRTILINDKFETYSTWYNRNININSGTGANGKVILNNKVNPLFTITMNKGTLSLEQNFFDNNKEANLEGLVANGGTIDFSNNQAGDTLNIGTLSTANSSNITNLILDYSGSTNEIDSLAISALSSPYATLNLSDINILSDSLLDNTSLSYITGNISNLNLVSSAIVSTSGGYIYTFTPNATKGVLDISKAMIPHPLPEMITNTAYGDSFSITTDDFAPLSDVSSPTSLGTLAGEARTFTINGNSHQLSGIDSDGITKQEGITLGSGQTLVLKDINAMKDYTTAINNQGGILSLSSVVFNSNSNVDINNTGTANLSGTNTINAGITGTGTTNIINGTTSLYAPMVQNNLTIYATGTLTANASNLSISNAITNSGTLNLTGGTNNQNIGGLGTTYIQGNVNNTGLIEQNVEILSAGHLTSSLNSLSNIVNNGTLSILDGNISNDTSILGTGTNEITGEMNLNSNTLSANNTINIANGSIIKTTINSLTDYGKIEASNINITGNTEFQYLVNGSGWFQTKGQTETFTILDGSITGAFTTNTALNNRYNFVSWDNGVLTLEYINTIEELIKEAGGNQNNINTGIAYDEATGLTGKALEVKNQLDTLSQTDTKEYLKALDSLAPQQISIAKINASNISQNIYNAVSKHLQQKNTAVKQRYGLSAGDEAKLSNSVWLEGLYNKMDYSGDKNFNGQSFGGAFGFDRTISDLSTLGFGYAYANSKIDSIGKENTANSHNLFVYANWNNENNIYVDGIIGYSFSNYNEKKTITGLGSASADYNVNALSAQVMAQYKPNNFLIPFAAVRYIYASQGSYKDGFEQEISSGKDQSLTGVLGTKITNTYGNFTPEIKLGLTYDIMQKGDDVVVSLQNGSSYLIEADQLDKLGFEVGAKLGYNLTDTSDLSVGYEGQIRNKYYNHTGTFNFRYRF